MQAYVLVKCDTGSETKIISEFGEHKEISEINGVWGDYDIFLKIVTFDLEGIENIVKRLRNHPDVTETKTMHVLYGQGGTIDHQQDEE